MQKLELATKYSHTRQRELGGLMDINIVINDQDAPEADSTDRIISRMVVNNRQQIVVKHGHVLSPQVYVTTSSKQESKYFYVTIAQWFFETSLKSLLVSDAFSCCHKHIERESNE
jgi:hypothetical protein